jgi:hypothetical protein
LTDLGESDAVANADHRTLPATDHITEGAYGVGLTEALDTHRA